MIIENENNTSLLLRETGFTPLYSFQEITNENDKAMYMTDTNNYWGKSQSLEKEINDIIAMVTKPEKEFSKDEFIKYITCLTYQQREIIKSQLDKKTLETFNAKIKLFKDCQESIKLLFINPIENDCQLINASFPLFYSNTYDVITEIVASSSNWRISQIKYMFMSLYNMELEPFILEKNSNEIGLFIKSLFSRLRKENKTPKKHQCLQDVRMLIKKGFFWTNNDILQEMIYERSASDLRCIDEEMQKQKKMSLNEAIQEDKVDSNIKKCINVLLSLLIGSKTYYSELLHQVSNQKKAALVNRLILSKNSMSHLEININSSDNSKDKSSIPKETISFLKHYMDSTIQKETMAK